MATEFSSLSSLQMADLCLLTLTLESHLERAIAIFHKLHARHEAGGVRKTDDRVVLWGFVLGWVGSCCVVLLKSRVGIGNICVWFGGGGGKLAYELDAQKGSFCHLVGLYISLLSARCSGGLMALILLRRCGRGCGRAGGLACCRERVVFGCGFGECLVCGVWWFDEGG